MNVREVLLQPDRKWRAQRPASAAEIAQLQLQAKAQLPSEYVELLQLSNGGEGCLALPPLYFQLYSVKNCIDLFHTNDQLNEHFRSFMFFGSNGGMELIAFDLRLAQPWPIVMIDPIAGPESAQQLAPDIATFILSLGLASEER